MPIYEYACGSCGCRVEVLQGINDLPLTECKECHKQALQKLISPSLFRLKGGGWYETDFKKESDKKKNLVNNEESPSSVAPAGKPESNSSSGDNTASSSTTSKSETTE